MEKWLHLKPTSETSGRTDEGVDEREIVLKTTQSVHFILTLMSTWCLNLTLIIS